MKRALCYGSIVGLSLFVLACHKDDTPQTSSGGSVSSGSSAQPTSPTTPTTTTSKPTTNTTSNPPSTNTQGSNPPAQPSPVTPPVACKSTLAIPAVFTNQASCQTQSNAPILYIASPVMPFTITQASFKTVPAGVNCGTTANLTLQGEGVAQAPQPFCPGATVKADIRFGRFGQMPLQVTSCSPNPLLIPLNQSGAPTCRPMVTLTENAGTLTCNATCSQ